jgi:hypothetical protein
MSGPLHNSPLYPHYSWNRALAGLHFGSGCSGEVKNFIAVPKIGPLSLCHPVRKLTALPTTVPRICHRSA